MVIQAGTEALGCLLINAFRKLGLQHAGYFFDPPVFTPQLQTATEYHHFIRQASGYFQTKQCRNQFTPRQISTCAKDHQDTWLDSFHFSSLSCCTSCKPKAITSWKARSSC